MPPAKATILLVDDEDLVRNVARRLLELGGYRVLEAATAVEALEVVRTHEGAIELLVTDIQMAGLSGIELALRVEQERPGIRIILITGYAGMLERQPDHPILEKPFTKNDLLFKVDEILGGKPVA